MARKPTRKAAAANGRKRAHLGQLFDATNYREIIRRPIEANTLGPIWEQVSPQDRLRLQSDSNKLYSNIGVIKGATDAKATFAVGRSWMPRFEGGDKAWGDRAGKWLADNWYPIAEVTGKDFQTSLFLSSVGIDRDGDVGIALTEYEDGFPAIQLVPSYAVGSRDSHFNRDGKLARGPYRGLREIDGCVINDVGRVVALHVLADDDNKDNWVSLRDMAWLYEPQWSDQKRGLPGFSHAILDLKDLRTVQGYEKMACALASSIGLLEYNETGLADASDPANVLASPGGNVNGELVVKEQVGGLIKHFKANSGGKLEAFKSERPGDQWDRFMNRLVRGALAGINWPFELAWDIQTLGGANTRAIIAMAMRTVEDRQDLLKPVARRAVGYAVAKAIKQGLLPANDEWYKWGFTLPRRMSADYGHDAAAQREDYLNGLINLGDICGERGVDLDKHIAARKEENAKLVAAGLPVPGVFGEMQTTATEQTATGVSQSVPPKQA